MHHPDWIRLTGVLAAGLIVGCSSAPSTSTAPTSSALTSSTSSSPTSSALTGSASSAPTSAVTSAPAQVQITSASVGATDATVTVQDMGSQPLSLSGWTLIVGSTPVQLPSGATIPAGQRLTLHTATGSNTGTDVFLGQSTQALASALQPGAHVALETPTGSTVASFTVPNG